MIPPLWESAIFCFMWYCGRVQAQVLQKQYTEMCPPDHEVSGSSPWAPITGPVSVTECAIRCLMETRCKAFQRTERDENDVLCEMFDDDQLTCSLTTHKVSSYKTRRECPTLFTYERSTSSCYYVESLLTGNQGQALSECTNNHGLEVHLVAIETSLEQTFLDTFLDAACPAADGSCKWWLGGEYHDDAWYWNLASSRKRMQHENWAASEPTLGETYVIMLRGIGSAEYKWASVNFDKVNYSGYPVCEYDIE